MSYVSWAYQYYLGRYPESISAKDWHEYNSGGDFAAMRDALTDSDEYRISGLFSTPKPRIGTFFHPQENSPKICVLGNCQGPEIAKAIAAMATVPISVCGLEIMDIAHTRNEMIDLIRSADHIVSCKVYSEEYSDISCEIIREKYKKDVIEFSPIHFTGVHPDMIVLGAYGKRVQSPIGDYNSRIILSAFISGMSQLETADLFREETYERSGYFNEFGWSETTMIEREEKLGENGVRIAEWFLREVKQTPLLYTVNHPAPTVFGKFAEKILDHVGISRRNAAVNLAGDKLSTDVIWPVEPEVAARHGIAYDTAPLYWKGGVALTREEFVWRSFKSYATIGNEFLIDAIGPRRLNF